MADFKPLVKKYLDEKGIKYKEEENGLLTIYYSAENLNDIKVMIHVDPDEGKAEFVCYSIGRFADDLFAKGLMACNACNSQYRWVKFYLDDDNDVTVRADAILDESTCGAECLEMVRRMVGIVDEAYPVFMKARWA